MKALLTLCYGLGLILPLAAQPPMPPGATPETPYYPVKKGNTWTYKAGTDTVTVRIDGTKKLMGDDAKKYGVMEGQEVHELVTSIGGTTVANEWIMVKADGVYRVAVGGVPVTPHLNFFKLPYKKDDSWNVESKIGAETLKGKFTAGGEETLKLGDKEYKTVTVKGPELLANGQKLSLTYWFAEKVGMVKQEAKLGQVPIVLELTRFEEGK